MVNGRCCGCQLDKEAGQGCKIEDAWLVLCPKVVTEATGVDEQSERVSAVCHKKVDSYRLCGQGFTDDTEGSGKAVKLYRWECGGLVVVCSCKCKKRMQLCCLVL